MKLSNIIAPSFYGVHRDIRNNRYTHYWLKGGRGSTKSSFVSVEIILGIMKNQNANCVALRKVAGTIKDSIYAQSGKVLALKNKSDGAYIHTYRAENNIPRYR